MADPPDDPPNPPPGDPPDDPWWAPARHETRRPLLLARNRIQAMLRLWLGEGGFLEADPAALALSPGNEAHLHGIAARVHGPDGAARLLWLHTSPEFALKKLLAAGEERLFAFAHVFRDRERGALHAPEFTMLEWYRAGEPYEALMADCAAVLAIAARGAGATALRFGEATCDPFAPPERVTVADALGEHAGLDLLATIRADGTGDGAALAAQMAAAGLPGREGDTWSDLLSKALVARVEPRRGLGRATILDRYPAPEAALALRAPDDPREALRFELYACGVELANGFAELADPVEQRARFTAEMDEMERVHGRRHPLDEGFLAALAHLPEASGIALGFDRLVMLATGAPRIDEVMWAPPP